MSDFFLRLVENKDLLLFGFITVIPLAAILAPTWLAYRKAAMNAQLKSDMIARGMSAHDIERVLAAGPTSKSDEDLQDEATDANA